MKYFDRVKISAKEAEIAKEQNPVLDMFLLTKEGHDLLVLAPLFIATFFQSLENDPKTAKAFHLLANASTEKLKSVYRLLALYLFWSIDRFCGFSLLGDERVLLPLRAVWGWEHHSLTVMIARFSTRPEEEVVVCPVPLIANIVGSEFDTHFAQAHLTNATKFAWANIGNIK